VPINLDSIGPETDPNSLKGMDLFRIQNQGPPSSQDNNIEGSHLRANTMNFNQVNPSENLNNIDMSEGPGL